MTSGAGCALDGSVLVLNKFFMVVHVISVRRAFCLLFKELAEVIAIDDGQYVAFNFTSWREASQARSLFQGPDDEFIRTVHETLLRARRAPDQPSASPRAIPPQVPKLESVSRQRLLVG